MDPLTIILIVLLVLLVAGGVGYNGGAYIAPLGSLAALVLIALVVVLLVDSRPAGRFPLLPPRVAPSLKAAGLLCCSGPTTRYSGVVRTRPTTARGDRGHHAP